MTGVIIASHGSMAGAALELCEMLTGPKALTHAVGFFPGESPEELTEKFKRALSAIGGPALILTDIRGGSPCNAAMAMALTHEKVKVVSGFNIPLLLHVFDIREETEDLEVLTSEALAVGRAAMRLITAE